MHEAIEAIDAGPLTTKVNNRKILEGFYMGLGVSDTTNIIRIIDKLDKVGTDGVTTMLSNELELSATTIDKILNLATIKGSGELVINRIKDLDVKSDLLNEGLNELEFVIQQLEKHKNGTFLVDMSIARGLAYYTGTVYESTISQTIRSFQQFVVAAVMIISLGDFVNKKLPGIGISIGLTRIFAKLMKEGKIKAYPENTNRNPRGAYTECFI
jgi:histidyl-tRNA synthetase